MLADTIVTDARDARQGGVVVPVVAIARCDRMIESSTEQKQDDDH